MDYARIRTQIVKRPTGLAIYVRAPRTLRSMGLGDDSGTILPSFNPVTPSAPSSIDLTSLFNPSTISAGSGILPTYYPTPSGPLIPSDSILYPLTVAPPGSTQQATLQSAARTLAAGASSISSLIFPKVQAPAPAPQQAPTMGGVSNFLAQNSGVAGLSNQALIAGALGLGIVVMLIARRK